MNKNAIKFGIIVIIVGVAVSGYGLLLKISHDSCLERAYEREEPTIIPLCPSDDSARFFFVGLPVIGIGVLIIVLGIKEATILEQVFGRSD